MIYNSSSLRFTELVSALSSQTNLPSSIHVRSKLLSPWTIDSPPEGWTISSSISSTSPDPNPWFTLSSQSRSQVYAFGSIPPEILTEGGKTTINQVQESNSFPSFPSSNLWSIVILSPPLHNDSKSHPPRLDLWISSESHFFSGSLESRIFEKSSEDLIGQEKALLSFIIKQWLPSELNHLESNISSNETDQRRSEVNKDEEKSVVLCGIEQRLVDLIQSWSKVENEKETLKVDWVNSCLVYMKSYDLSEEVLQEKLIDGRWEVCKIEERDIDLVQRINKLPFPKGYIRSHLAHSIMIRDSHHTPSSSSTEGNQVGWVYTHDDLSLASLQVLESFRRISSSPNKKSYESSQDSPLNSNAISSQDSNPKIIKKTHNIGIGSHLIRLVSPKVLKAQSYALTKAGVSMSISSPSQYPFTSETSLSQRSEFQKLSSVELDPKPVLAFTEVSNLSGRKFFEKIGFKSVQKNAWVGIKV